MNNEFVLPHGLVSPPTDTFYSFQLVTMCVVILILASYLYFRILRRSGPRRLSTKKQHILTKVDAILEMDESCCLSQKQAYLLWRLIRKTGHYYFGNAILTAPLDDAISMCVRTSSDTLSKQLYELFIQLNQSVYDPNQKIDKLDIKPLLSRWFYDNQALKMEVFK